MHFNYCPAQWQDMSVLVLALSYMDLMLMRLAASSSADPRSGDERLGAMGVANLKTGQYSLNAFDKTHSGSSWVVSQHSSVFKLSCRVVNRPLVFVVDTRFLAGVSNSEASFFRWD